MSRPYNEDWERKKSYLIRSLFHDIPFRALSPVLERSEETREHSALSSDTQTPQESTSSPEVYAEYRTTTSYTSSDPAPPSSGVYRIQDSTPYSPLPPLIIERIPNKHDDPPEYYQKLLSKIRLIYRKMFIEGRSLSDDDFFDSDHEKISLNETFEMAAHLSDLTEVSHSHCSDGYSADTEMSDNEESIDNSFDSVSINSDNDRRKAVEFDRVLETRNFEVCDNFEFGNSRVCVNFREQGNVQGLEGASLISDEEANYSQVTTQADVHIDGAQRSADRPSPVYEEVLGLVSVDAVTEAVDLSRRPEQPIDTPNPTYIEAAPGLPQISGFTQNRTQLPDVTKDYVYAELPPDSAPRGSSGDLPALPQTLEKEALLDVPVYTADVTSPILPTPKRFNKSGVSANQGSPKVSEDQDTNHRETTAESEIHRSSSSDVPANNITQDHAFVLRFKKSAERSFITRDFEKEATGLGTQEPTSSTEDTENLTNSHIEVIRTPRPNVSVQSIPVDITRHTSDMDMTCERIDSVPRDISSVTSDCQDGGHTTPGPANSKTSCDFDEVLRSILNRSSQENVQVNESNRKRSYEEMSAQTENISWNELRANFFVGTPKILRLCSCVDHLCT